MDNAYNGQAALRVAEGSLDLNDLRAELRNISGYVVEGIPQGADATNDYWRAKVASLKAKIAKARLS